MPISLSLPRADGGVEAYELVGTPTERPASAPRFNRIAYAAAHVVSDPCRDTRPWEAPAVDWATAFGRLNELWLELFRECFCSALLPPCPDHGSDCVPLAVVSRRSMGGTHGASKLPGGADRPLL